MLGLIVLVLLRSDIAVKGMVYSSKHFAWVAIASFTILHGKLKFNDWNLINKCININIRTIKKKNEEEEEKRLTIQKDSFPFIWLLTQERIQQTHHFESCFS